MSKALYRPLRTCAGCRKKGEKEEFLRIAKQEGTKVILDREQRAGGRGVYLCKNSDCLMRARKKRALERGLKAPVGEEIYEKLAEELQ